MNYGSEALLPTRTSVNPTSPAGAEYVQEGDVLYVVQDGDKRRVFKSCGSLQGWGIGTAHEAHHDQAGYCLGYFTVIGIVNLAETGITTEGEIPNRKLPLAVFK